MNAPDPDAPHRDLADPGPAPSSPGWALLRATLAPQRADIAKGLASSLGWTLTKIAVPAVIRVAVDRGIVARESGALTRWCAVIAVLGLLTLLLLLARSFLASPARTQAELRSVQPDRPAMPYGTT